MAPLLQQPERWGKKERSDIVEKKRGRYFVSSYTSASQLSSSTGVFVSTPPFTARRPGRRLRVNPALFLSSFGFCIFHAFKSSGWRVARLRGARGCPRAGVKTSFFFPFLSPPRPFPALPFPPPVLSLLPSLLLLSGLGPAQVIRHQVRQMQHRLQQE